MKIIQICGSYSWSGIEIQTFAISEALAKLENEVILICPKNCQFGKEKSKFGICVYPINYKNNYFLILFSFIKAFKYVNPDVIHCQQSEDLRFVVPALRYLKYKTPLVFTKRMSFNICKNNIIQKYLYNRIDKIHAISEYVRCNIQTITPVEPERIEVFYNGVNLDMFNPKLYNKNEERAKYSFTSDTIVIGIIGLVSPLMGHLEFIEFASTLNIFLNGNVKFMIVGGAIYGEEDYYDQIKNHAVWELGKDNIIFTGYINDVPHFLSIMDILVFPFYEEELLNVVLEAMAMGIPIVASNSGGVPEIIENDITGILVNPKDSHAIVSGVLEFLLNSSKADVIRENAINYIKKNHNFNIYIEKLQTSYHLLINKNFRFKSQSK